MFFLAFMKCNIRQVAEDEAEVEYKALIFKVCQKVYTLYYPLINIQQIDRWYDRS